jgi:hypothetical protein
MLDAVHCLGYVSHKDVSETRPVSVIRCTRQYDLIQLDMLGRVHWFGLGLSNGTIWVISFPLLLLKTEIGQIPETCNFCDLFSDVVSIWLYSAERYGDWWILGHLEGSGSDIIEYNLGICPKGLRKTMNTLSEGSWCFGRDLNWTLSYCKYRVSPLDQYVRRRNVVAYLQYSPDNGQCATKYSIRTS